MLRSLKDLERYTVRASDGDAGSVEDFLLDDDLWTVRYAVAEVCGLGGRRRVLVSAIAFGQAESSTQRFHVALTVDGVSKGPSVQVDRQVSRRPGQDQPRDRGRYWDTSGLCGAWSYPGLRLLAGGPEPRAHSSHESGDRHLRSAREVRGYRIEGSDEAIGHVEDFIVDDELWWVRYLVIDTSEWWFGKKVLVAPHWADSISGKNRAVHVHMTRQAIKDSPKWDGSAGINREYEARLYDYHGRPRYWESSDASHPAGRSRGDLG